MSERFRVSPQLAPSLVEHGLAPAAVLQAAGLPPGLFAQEKAWVDTGELFALWRAIGELSADPAIGVALGIHSPQRLEPTALAALCSRNYADALERVARYKRLQCPEEIRVTPGPEGTWVEFVFLLGKETEPPLLIDVCLAWILEIGRKGTGQGLVPLRLELTRAAAPHLEAHFGCPVRYHAERNAMLLRTDDLERPFLTHNPQLLAVVAPHLEEELCARMSLETQIRLTLKRMLAGRHPRVGEVATALRLSSRTLQRRLTDAGLSFQKLLDEARQDLARFYLAESRLELSETAYLLGYEDSNSFVRAFQRWEGMPPGRWRSLQLR